MRNWILLITALSSISWCEGVAAHDGHDQENLKTSGLAKNQRTWSDVSGAFHVHGSFVSIKKGNVQIRKEDGSLLDLKIEAMSPIDRSWVMDRAAGIRRLNSDPDLLLLAQLKPIKTERDLAVSAPPILSFFKPFNDTLKFRWDDSFFYVESNGIPDHQMMVGITAWQQQVPLPQRYTTDNSWRIPLKPVPAQHPLSAKDNFFRGAIALAVNGVPIFNPIKNDGKTDTLLAGELDEFGGHCGRADDYHYHVAPVHLEPKVGKGNPLAFALDGYPIHGYEESDGTKVEKLDCMNGHEDQEGHYHYHATKTYPYINGGFHGEVTQRGGQVDPQPQAEPRRAAQAPLREARITQFESPKTGSYRLTYEVRGQKNFVNYSYKENGAAVFEFVDSDGKTRTETYQPDDRTNRPARLNRVLLYVATPLSLGGIFFYYRLRMRRKR